MKHSIRNRSLKRNFKFTLLSVCILAVISFSVKAQDNLYYGAKFGTTVSQFTDEQPHTNVMQGLTGGLFIGYMLNEKMAVQLEINYLEEGGQLLNFETEADLGYDNWYVTKADNQRLTLHNLDIPIIFKYYIPLESAKLFAVLGADVGVNIYSNSRHETTVYANDGSIITFNGDENITSKIEQYSVGATGGIGFEIPISDNNYFLIEARYKYGIMPTFKGYSYRGIPQVNGDLNNNTMYFTIGLGF